MTGRLTRLIAALLLLGNFGCGFDFGNHFRNTMQSGIFRKQPQPVLSVDISAKELVDHLNQQRRGLNNWRSNHTTLTVSGPGIPIRQKLSGLFICSAPRSFRLSAGNLMASVDFGANTDLCWAWAKPGAPAVLSWSHDDAYLLNELPGQFPWLEAEWLAVVAGITPLDSAEFSLADPSEDPSSALLHKMPTPPPLFLRQAQQAADSGRKALVRRRQTSAGTVTDVLKVSLLSGNPEEAFAFDHEGRLMIQARFLSHHRIDDMTLPQEVVVDAVQAGFQLNLKFNKVQTNVTEDQQIWHPPSGDDLQIVDLVDVVRYWQSEPNEFQERERVQPAPEFDQEPPLFDEETTVATHRRFRWPWEWWR